MHNCFVILRSTRVRMGKQTDRGNRAYFKQNDRHKWKVRDFLRIEITIAPTSARNLASGSKIVFVKHDSSLQNQRITRFVQVV